MKKQEIITFVKENKKFDLLWTSQILSQITLNMINFVMATRIYEKTGSTLAVSFLWIFYYLPAFFLGPISGFFVDLWSLRKILLYTNFLQGLTMLLFLFMGEKIYPIYPIVFLYSLLNQLYNPAEGASIPWLVKKKHLPMANSLFMLTAQGSLIFGLGVSGILMRLFGRNNPIWISAISLFLAAASVYFLPKNEPHRESWLRSFSRFWREIKVGYSFIKNTRIILFPLLVMIVVQLFLVTFGVALPSFSNKILSIQVQDAGPLLIIPAGLGALTGTFLMTRYGYKFRKRTLMKFGFATAAAVLLIFSVLVPFLGSYKTALATPLMYLLGIAGFFIVVPSQTLIQENTLPSLRGRVYGAWGFLTNIVLLPCLLFASTVVDLVGVRTFILIASILVFLMLAFFDRVERYILSKEEGLPISLNLRNEANGT